MQLCWMQRRATLKGDLFEVSDTRCMQPSGLCNGHGSGVPLELSLSFACVANTLLVYVLVYV